MLQGRRCDTVQGLWRLPKRSRRDSSLDAAWEPLCRCMRRRNRATVKFLMKRCCDQRWGYRKRCDAARGGTKPLCRCMRDCRRWCRKDAVVAKGAADEMLSLQNIVLLYERLREMLSWKQCDAARNILLYCCMRAIKPLWFYRGSWLWAVMRIETLDVRRCCDVAVMSLRGA